MKKEIHGIACSIIRTGKGIERKSKKEDLRPKRKQGEWESSFKLSANANMDMLLGAFVEIYFRDKAGELKERS